MIREIQALYNETIRNEAAARFGVGPGELNNLGGFESYVYEYRKGEQDYILKVTHSIRRTAEYIMGELDWLNYLADHGVSVSRAVASERGNLVERIELGDSYFLVYSFVKAQGRLARGEAWNTSLFEIWGETMGKMHRLTRDYQLPNPAWKRQEWYEEEQLKIDKYLPSSETRIIEQTQKLLARIHQLPKDRNTYGLVHGDFHQGNFFIDEVGRITVFDFDDIGYNWFANDIAISLFYVLWRSFSSEEERRAEAERFMEFFMRGYNREHQLDPWWANHMHDFLKMRRALLVSVFNQAFDMNNMAEKTKKEYEELARGTEQDLPWVEIDFSRFLK